MGKSSLTEWGRPWNAIDRRAFASAAAAHEWCLAATMRVLWSTGTMYCAVIHTMEVLLAYSVGAAGSVEPSSRAPQKVSCR